MSMDAYFLELLKKVRDHIYEQHQRPLKVAIFAYQDIMANTQTLEHLFGREAVASLPKREDSDEILGWHPAAYTDYMDVVYETDAVMRLLDLEVDYFDLANARGFEKILDLNDPLPEHIDRDYDLVIDSCITEKCFNISQAMFNTYNLLKPDGIVIHRSSFSRFNISFYNPTPNLYYDFYEQNNSTVIDCVIVDTIEYDPPRYLIKDAPRKSFFCKYKGYFTYLFTIAQKGSSSEPKTPILSKVRNNPHSLNKK